MVGGAAEGTNSMPAMVRDGCAGTEFGFDRETGDFQEPDRPVPVGAERLEVFDHGVVIEGLSEKRPSDHRCEVEVADRQCIGVAQCTLRDLGGCPDSDSRHGPQSRFGVDAVHRHCFFEAVCNSGGKDDRLRSFRIDIRTVILPGRDPSPHLCGRGHEHAGRSRSRRRLSEPPHKLAPRSEGRYAVHLLLKDRWNESFEYSASSQHAQIWESPMGFDNFRVGWCEVAENVVEAEHLG